jgi:pyrimidine operon attenuation protein/uracil phosphoribosyltransferase
MAEPILTAAQIEARLQRLAIEIWEHNADVKQLILLGIEGQGAAVAAELASILRPRVPFPILVGTAVVDKKALIPPPIALKSIEPSSLSKGPVVLVDDVLNTGRVLSYAFAALLPFGPPKIQLAVLVARHHSLFPLKPDFVGHSLSTTLEEHIEVRLGEGAFLI